MRLILWLWCGWGVYWLLAAVRSKPTQRREALGSRLGQVLLIGAGGTLMAWPVPRWSALDLRLWPASAAGLWFGAALVAGGLAFAIWARRHLGANWSGMATVKQDHELIRSGPYAWVRHPIYTGLLTALLGTAIASGMLRAVLGLALIAAAFLYKSRVEEGFMRETFPSEYPRYSAEVPALIPFARRRRPAARP